MNYNSLSEYFYKLYNICLLLMLLPLAVFLSLYYLLNSGNLISVMDYDNPLTTILVFLFPILAATELTIVHLVMAKKYIITNNEQSLGTRLDKYYSFVIVKNTITTVLCLLMALGLYLTGRGLFSVYFILIMSWMFIQWPFPGKVSRDLKLKGDEAKMVLTKGEAFK